MKKTLCFFKTVFFVFMLCLGDLYCFNSASAIIGISESVNENGHSGFVLDFRTQKDVQGFRKSLKQLEILFLEREKKYRGKEIINMFDLSSKELNNAFKELFCDHFDQYSLFILEKMCEMFSGVILTDFIVNEESGMMIVNNHTLYENFVGRIMHPLELLLAEGKYTNIAIFVDWQNCNLIFRY